MRFHRSFAAVSTALLMALSPLAAPCAYADESPTTPRATQPSARPALFAEEASDSPVRVSIDNLSPRVVTTENTLTLTGTITNEGIFDIQSPTLTVYMQEHAPSSIADISAYFTGALWDGTVIYEAPLHLTVPAGHSRGFSVTIPRDSLPLTDPDSWGPRGLTAHIDTDSDSALDRSLLLWDAGAQITAARGCAAMTWTASNAPANAMALANDLAAIPGVSIAVDPSLLTPATPTPDHAQSTPDLQLQAATAHLAASAHELIALLPTDADPALVAATAQPALIEASLAGLAAYGQSSRPQHPDPLTPAGVQPPSADSPESADTGQSHNAPAHTLTAPIIRNVLWPADDRFSTELLKAFPANPVIAPASAVQPHINVDFTPAPIIAVNTEDGSTSLGGHTRQTSTVISQYDPAAQLLAWENPTTDDALDRDQLLGAIGALSSRESATNDIAFFAALPRNSSITTDTIQRLRALMDHRWVEGIRLSNLLETPATDVDRTPIPAQVLAPVERDAARAIERALHTATPLTPAVVNPQEFTADMHAHALAALTASAKDLDVAHSALTVERYATTLSTSVHAESSVTVNLINKTANFPVRVTNTLPWSVNVLVSLSPSDPRLRVGSSIPATIPAGSTQTVEVPVTAIGAGDIDVTYIVRAPNGELLDASQTVEVRLRAGWEDALTASFGVLVAAAFIGGLVRTVRRRLRAHDAPGTGGPILHGMIPVSDYLDRKENQ